jgi:hypothetical protein
MKYSRIHVTDSTAPAPIYKRFVLDGIRFYKCTFPTGAWQTYVYPKATPYKDMPTCHIQLSGKMVEPTGVWPDQLAGWISREEQFIVPEGTFTRLAQEDTVRWCCTGVADNERTDYVETVHLATGATLALVADDNLLVISGSVTNGTKSFGEEKHLKVASANVTLTAESEVFGFKWKSADVMTAYPTLTELGTGIVGPGGLDALKLAKWAVLKDARTAAIDAPLTTPYGSFDCTPASRTSITDAILLLQTMNALGTTGQTVDFTLADNTTATFTLSQMINVGLLLGQKTQYVYAHGRVLRTALEAATTVEEVNSVTW